MARRINYPKHSVAQAETTPIIYILITIQFVSSYDTPGDALGKDPNLKIDQNIGKGALMRLGIKIPSIVLAN
ncbi:MAG: hypothetical protein Q9205_003894 [Flavoplaca limonia]